MSANSQEVDVIPRQMRRFPGSSPAMPKGNPNDERPANPAETSVEVTSRDTKPELVSMSPEATTLFLPSRFEFYDFSALSVGRLKGYHQAKFYKAANESKDRHVADALTSLFPPGIKAEELTIPDFYFVMYWLRLNSYMRTELVHNGMCNNPRHLKDVREGRLPPESLKTVEVITKTRLDQVELPVDYLAGFDSELQELVSVLNPLGYTLTAPRMFDVIELNEEFSDAPNFDEISYLADRAACICKADSTRSTLKERIQIVETLDLNFLELLEEWRHRCSSYGVRESIKFKCKGCGADVENDISISAHSFL